MILSPNFFKKHQNKAEFKNLDDSEVPNYDFPGHSWVLGVDNLAKWQKNMLQLKLFGGLFGHKSADS